MDGQCKDCRFFAGGDCRRFPPSVIASHQGFTNSTEAETRWPTVKPYAGCGEFQPSPVHD